MANWSIWKCIVWKCKCLDLARHKMRVFDRLHGKSYWKHFLWWDVFFIHLFMTRYITLDISRTFQTWYNFFTIAFIIGEYVHTLEIKLSLSIIKLIMYFFLFPSMRRWKWCWRKTFDSIPQTVTVCQFHLYPQTWTICLKK